MSKDTPNKPIPGILREISAAEEKTLDSNGVPVKIGRQYQRAQVQPEGYNADDHTVTLTLTSEQPVDRWFGSEILSHKKGAIRSTRLKNGISLLFNHSYDQLLGRSISYKTPDGGPLSLTYRFGPSALAQEKEAEVAAEVLKDSSGGYVVYEWEITEDKNGVRTYLAVDWEPVEGSLVTVPADPSVGVGRGIPVKYTLRKLGEDGEAVEVRKFTFDPVSNRSLEDPDDDEEDDDDDDSDEVDEGDRALSAGGNAGEATNVTEVGVPAGARSEESSATQTQSTQRTEGTPMAETNNTPATQVVDIAAQNQERLTGLRALHTEYPNEFSERALKAAENLGTPVETVKARIADAIITSSQRSEVPTVADEVFGGMTDKDLSRYSIASAYRAAVNLRTPGTFKGKDKEGGFEREVSEDLRKAAESRGITGLGAGVVIPSSTTRSLARNHQQRALASGGNAGTATNFTVVESDPIELLRARTVCLALGARMLTGLHGAIKMPRQSAAGTSNWLAEGSNASETDPTLDSITMTPHRLSMQNAYYLDLLAQSNLSVDSFLAADRLQVLTRSLDTAGLAGSGSSNVPLGLLNQSGLAAVLAGTTRAANGTVTAGLGGVPLTFVDLNNLEAAISTANGDIGTMAWATTPKVRAAGRSTPQIPGTASGFLWPNSKVGPNGVQEGPLGYNAIATSNSVLTGFTANSVNNLHAIILGVWDQMMFGDWGLSEVIADPYTGAASALYTITEHAYYDTNVRHVPSFAACTSALPS